MLMSSLLVRPRNHVDSNGTGNWPRMTAATKAAANARTIATEATKPASKARTTTLPAVPLSRPSNRSSRPAPSLIRRPPCLQRTLPQRAGRVHIRRRGVFWVETCDAERIRHSLCSVILSGASLRAKSKDPHLVASSAWVADPSQAQDDTEPVEDPERTGRCAKLARVRARWTGDQARRLRVSRSGRLATDQKAVRRRGPGRVVLGSKPQLATAKQLVRWAGDSTQARSLRLQKNSCAGFGESQA